MKKIILATLLLFLSAAPCLADEWTKDDTTREWLFIALTAFDIYQTDLAVRAGGTESNPFVTPLVGESPSTEKLCTLFVGWTLTHYGIAKVLPKKLRRFWQDGIIIYTIHDIGYSWGTKLVFKF